jgi:hypothetical protein
MDLQRRIWKQQCDNDSETVKCRMIDAALLSSAQRSPVHVVLLSQHTPVLMPAVRPSFESPWPHAAALLHRSSTPPPPSPGPAHNSQQGRSTAPTPATQHGRICVMAFQQRMGGSRGCRWGIYFALANGFVLFWSLPTWVAVERILVGDAILAVIRHVYVCPPTPSSVSVLKTHVCSCSGQGVTHAGYKGADRL